jgi:hypothetical protein
MDKVKGSMEVLSDMQITADTTGMDAHSKTILRNKEVLAIILGEVIAEYKGYTRKEVMDFIEMDSMTSEMEVSSGRTNTQVQGENPEFVQLNEKTSYFDLVFRAKNPLLSTKDVFVSLHMDIEPQKTYQPGYPIEKRGIYYLARRLSSQLSLLTEKTDYGQLEKCYSIWICKDDIPQRDQYSVAIYEMANTKNSSKYNIKKENYDLLTLVIIKLGNRVYNGKKEEEWYELLRFLDTIMSPHKEDFMDKVKEYIDFSENEELWKEVTLVSGLGQSIFEEGLEKGIQALIEDNLEEKISKEKSLEKLQRRFQLTEEQAIAYYKRFAENV